ncbi:hypothetical protein [Elstera cyanobacteriorum]|uniref:hypothetical protein n=1 Tax=Elstera cyanobacteriorum TaxID=2022747 RepID=UPI00113FF7D8|nr:hypothetical protein [Elstera cyanobacteriorum]
MKKEKLNLFMIRIMSRAISVIAFIYIIFLFYKEIDRIIFPLPPSEVPKNEPLIIRSQSVFYEYTDNLRPSGRRFSHDGKQVGLVCALSVYDRPKMATPSHSSYIDAWLSNEFGRAFLVLYDEQKNYIGAVEVDDSRANPSPLSWGDCMALPE